MKRKHLGIRLKDIDTLKTKFVKLPKETMDYLNKQSGKPPYEYIKEYLNDSKMYNELRNKFIEYVNKTLPKEVKASCLWCNGNSKDKEDKKCKNYHSEAQMNFFFASYEFVTIVERNKHLIKDKKIRKNLTLQFYECFAFSNGRVLFDLEKMAMLCLKAGFLSLSNIFANNTALQNLSIINNTIDELNDEELDAEMFDKEKSIYLEPQKKFFENKQKYYEKKHFIDTESNKQIENSECEPKKTNSQEVLKSLNKYGFNKLVKLNEIDLNQLTEHIFSNALPYQIAYLNFLGFIKYVNDNYCNSQKELHKTLSKILSTNERAIRGNLNGLRNEKSTDRKRYTAYQHTNSVEKHYQTII